MSSVAHKPLPDPAERRTSRSESSNERCLPSPRHYAIVGLTFVALALVTGCHHTKHHDYTPPPPPLRTQSSRRSPEPAPTRNDRAPIPAPTGHPDFTETGMASWYGPSGHHAADGSDYDGTGMTAAHKTLPLGTLARVTNLANGESVMVRITDRGPFAHGRVLDLSENAAKQIDLYRMGVAQVRIETFSSATPVVEGKWCVQTGAFSTEQDALDLKSALARKYTGARVIEFASATGYWVRIDPVRHDRTEATAIKDWIGSPLPQVVPYVVRIN